MTSINEKTLVYDVESDTLRHSKLTKLSYRTDCGYFSGRAGIIRLINLLLSSVGIFLLTPGYNPETYAADENDQPGIISEAKNITFAGYGDTVYTLCALVFGGCATLISLTFVVMLFFFLEVRCELAWERVNQKAHVLACLLAVGAAFTDVLSIQITQEKICMTSRCDEEIHATKVSRYEEVYYPPYFIFHYIAFMCFLGNAMLYSIASRIWLRNND